MLKALDDLKSRSPRLPLPPIVQSPEADGGVRGLGVVNNGRLRAAYLPSELNPARPSATGGAGKSLIPYELATKLFWIVSRVNNCHYCLGHQEGKLQKVGVTESTLLALDTDWAAFDVGEQAAFRFAHKLTHLPHQIGRQDVDLLRPHYSDDEILEIAFLVGRYNATNRWTDSLGIPQEDHRDFRSQLSGDELDGESRVAISKAIPRPPLNGFQEWRDESDTQADRVAWLSPSSASGEDQSLEPHERLLDSIAAAGPSWVSQVREARRVGTLPVSLKDKIAFVSAREDRAWYMQGLSLRRMADSGLTIEDAYRLGDSAEDAALPADGDAAGAAAERVALRFVSKLTARPQEITDRDITSLLDHFSEYQVAEIVYHTGLAATLNRLTETAGLALVELDSTPGRK
jgi:alkylhydroperoxidase family enzyme